MTAFEPTWVVARANRCSLGTSCNALPVVVHDDSMSRPGGTANSTSVVAPDSTHAW